MGDRIRFGIKAFCVAVALAVCAIPGAAWAVSYDVGGEKVEFAPVHKSFQSLKTLPPSLKKYVAAANPPGFVTLDAWFLKDEVAAYEKDPAAVTLFFMVRTTADAKNDRLTDDDMQGIKGLTAMNWATFAEEHGVDTAKLLNDMKSDLPKRTLAKLKREKGVTMMPVTVLSNHPRHLAAHNLQVVPRTVDGKTFDIYRVVGLTTLLIKGKLLYVEMIANYATNRDLGAVVMFTKSLALDTLKMNQ